MATLPATLPFVLGSEGEPAVETPKGAAKPPLELQVELVYPDGTTTRWDKDAREAKDRPTGISFRTQRYSGFADAQLTLNRRIDLDYPDLGLLEGLNLIGHEGSVAYEGRIATLPRNLQGGPSIGVQAQGWMSHAKDEPFVEIYVDRDLSRWGSPSRARVVEMNLAGYSFGSSSATPDEGGLPAVGQTISGAWVSNNKPLCEAWYDAGAGNLVSAVYFDPDFQGGSYTTQIFLAKDDTAKTADLSGNLGGGALPKYFGPRAVPYRFAVLQFFNSSETGGSAGASVTGWWRTLAVYGNHGLTRRGSDPGGFYVSDLIADISHRFASKLDTSGIQETTFAVPQAAFVSETLPYDAFQTLNAYHRWEMNVYEGRKLSYYPIDLNDWDWEVRLSDPGTTVQLQGDDTSKLCNGVVVRYRDLATGYETRLSPDDFPEQLRDDSPDNPANLNGLKLYTPLSISVPTTKEGALQIGRAFLAEFNQAQAPGSIVVTGHVRDRAGHWQQGWKVRASDRLIISDLPNDSVRVVGETSWDHDTKQLTLAIDSSMKRLDAILQRLGVAVEASGLQLP